jgi:hypothetical protein
MTGPALVPAMGSIRLSQRPNPSLVREQILQWLAGSPAAAKPVTALIGQEPDWWPQAQRNCGLGCPPHQHLFEFVCIVPVAVCKDANMDLIVAAHRSWSGKWSIDLNWTQKSPTAAGIRRVEGGFDTTYQAMEDISRIWLHLDRAFGA